MSGVGRGLSPACLNLLSLPPIQGCHAVKSRFAHIAVFGALAATLAVAGCGRKGPLDLPPAAGTAPPARAAGPHVGLSPMAEPQEPAAPAFDAQGRPVAPTNAPTKRLPMDWLID